jgi:transposase
MREMSVAEQRYQVVLAVLAEGRAVMEVASQWGVSRRTGIWWGHRAGRWERSGKPSSPSAS